LPFKATYNPREEFPSSPFGGIPRNWKLIQLTPLVQEEGEDVPPSGGSLEIGNSFTTGQPGPGQLKVPPSGGSLEIGNQGISASQAKNMLRSSPFGGIPRNWKRHTECE